MPAWLTVLIMGLIIFIFLSSAIACVICMLTHASMLFCYCLFALHALGLLFLLRRAVAAAAEASLYLLLRHIPIDGLRERQTPWGRPGVPLAAAATGRAYALTLINRFVRRVHDLQTEVGVVLALTHRQKSRSPASSAQFLAFSRLD